VKALPADTLAINNFGGYLRVIDSTETSLPVLLYANSLFDKSPVILTQIGCSYFELKDYKQAEKYLRQAVNCNPDFGQAHSALCDVYIQQNRLEEALIELFAGVKGMAGGGSYSQSSSRFAYLKQQAEENDTKEKFWNETRQQIKPEDALASLVPDDKKLKAPDLPACEKLEDWMQGGGYSNAAKSYNSFHNQLMAFSNEFLQIHKEVPMLPVNAVLRDYPDERLKLDCNLEYFRRESKKEADSFDDKMDAIMAKVNKATEDYFNQKEAYSKEYTTCMQGCGSDEYCIKECERVFCTKDCPATNTYNKFLQSCYDDYREAFQTTADNQKKILDDLYGFSGPTLQRIQSPYWSRIYAYEIQSVGLGIIGNIYMAYPRAFPFPAQSGCGTDCSLFANPAPRPPDIAEKNEPKGNQCPEGTKISLGIAFCSIELECESIEFGCAAGVAISAKRDFKNKSSTLFVGAGGELQLIGASAGMKVGATFTRTDAGESDFGGKIELSGTVGAGISAGGSVEMTATLMEGADTNYKNVIGAGF
jgi:tetratricopeptide (TPR) repeat protein